ncbi:hypothetical protein J2853_006058 [Streptosporangium lutulentum]|uniref:Uncharacterized protein n=1 Tax=Streptosporangium lutulentum TaxID=1461250 RepID=A0ABT9QJG0_9ACTN|nr:hypothetical protein [Streptosporangium lutulentum]
MPGSGPMRSASLPLILRPLPAPATTRPRPLFLAPRPAPLPLVLRPAPLFLVLRPLTVPATAWPASFLLVPEPASLPLALRPLTVPAGARPRMVPLAPARVSSIRPSIPVAPELAVPGVTTSMMTGSGPMRPLPVRVAILPERTAGSTGGGRPLVSRRRPAEDQVTQPARLPAVRVVRPSPPGTLGHPVLKPLERPIPVPLGGRAPVVFPVSVDGRVRRPFRCPTRGTVGSRLRVLDRADARQPNDHGQHTGSHGSQSNAPPVSSSFGGQTRIELHSSLPGMTNRLTIKNSRHPGPSRNDP